MPPAATRPTDDATGLPSGQVVIADRVVERTAAWTALQVDDVGGRPRRGGDVRLPRARVEVSGDTAVLRLELAVAWPAPVGAVAEAVRERVIDVVAATCGLKVTDIGVTVTELVHAPSGSRVR